jgi:hypothetical protein
MTGVLIAMVVLQGFYLTSDDYRLYTQARRNFFQPRPAPIFPAGTYPLPMPLIDPVTGHGMG